MFHSLVARAVEIHFALLEAIETLGRYAPCESPAVSVTPRAGTGVGATEAPRGLLWYRSRADGVDIECLDRPGPALLAAMQGATRAVVIDAIRSGAAAGTVQRVDLDRIAVQQIGGVSSRGFGLAATLVLGQALGALPPRLTLFGVEAGEAEGGEDPSAAVRAAIHAHVRRVQASVNGSDDWSG